MPKVASRAKPRSPAKRTTRSTSTKRPAPRGGKAKRTSAAGLPRGVIVGGALLAALGVTCILLALLSPSPLTPDVTARLFVTSTGDEPLETVVGTAAKGRWDAIYIHHSKTPGGDTSTLADLARARGIVGPPDHFVIGNGDGMGDGEVQVTSRWSQQAPAASPAQGARVEPGCISICLIGDFDRMRPTEAQRASLARLLAVLQARLQLGPDRVVQLSQEGSAAGVGRHFVR